MSCCADCTSALTRRKTFTSDMFSTPLERCLSTFDLTILGLAQMVGAGIFVLTGTVVRDIAGPAVILSFLIAGVAATLSALCYAEFGSLIPRTGSAYLFTYTIIGEGVGFLVGWCILAEQLIGAATVARSFSGAVDSIFNFAMRNATLEAFGEIDVPGFSAYPDFFSVVPVVLTALLAIFGAKATAWMNNVLTLFQVAVLAFIIVVGYVCGDVANWENADHGGFFPYGVSGAFSGAATCFFAFVGFDSIAVAGEEAKTPRRSVPQALLISMPVVSILYVLTSGALTMLQPFYEVNELAPYSVAFQRIGFAWASWIVNSGVLVALFTSLLSSQYAMPRIAYAMASDGLLFQWLGRVNAHTKTPVSAIASLDVIILIMSILIDIEVLVELYSVGTLLSFTFVAIALMKLHYEVPETHSLLYRYADTNCREESRLIAGLIKPMHAAGDLRPAAQKLPFVKGISAHMGTDHIMTAMLISQLCFGITLTVGFNAIGFYHWGLFVPLIIFGVAALLFFILLCCHKTNEVSAGFRLPLSPLFETMSVSINLLLMFMLQPLTWVRLAIWIALGALLYVLYSKENSRERLAALLITVPESDQGDEDETSSASSKTDSSPETPGDATGNYGAI